MHSKCLQGHGQASSPIMPLSVQGGAARPFHCKLSPPLPAPHVLGPCHRGSAPGFLPRPQPGAPGHQLRGLACLQVGLFLTVSFPLRMTTCPEGHWGFLGPAHPDSSACPASAPLTGTQTARLPPGPGGRAPALWEPHRGAPRQGRWACIWPAPQTMEHMLRLWGVCTQGSRVEQMRLEFYDSFIVWHCR